MKKPLGVSEQNTDGMMNAHSELFGLLLPIQSKLFGKYTTNCHTSFDILICTEAYRKSLGKALPITYFEEMGNAAGRQANKNEIPKPVVSQVA